MTDRVGKGPRTKAILGMPLASGARDDLRWSRSDAWITVGNRALVILMAFLVVFGLLVSINGAVIGNGTVTVENRYRTVQHLDGGIVARINVRNGDLVAPGDVLIQLDRVSDRAELTVIAERIDDLRIQQARLEAERDGRQSFEIPADVSRSEAILKTIATQEALFRARSDSLRGETSMLSERIEQVTAQLNGLIAQRDARGRERRLITEELASIRSLFAQGFANQQRLSALEREAARLDGELGRLASEIARVDGVLSETRLNLAQRRKSTVETVSDELRRVQSALNELVERRKALEDKVARADIRAPHGGRIHALAVQTEGGVIEPAKAILQIVPEDERLVIEARIRPQDIDSVRAGQTATVVLSAFNAQTTPRLKGEVLRVSAAELSASDGQSYFTAQVAIPPDELARLGSRQRLMPGMPAEVFIETDARSILSYLLKPLTDAMFRAFREV
ncbi:MAG: HlyD family type I secretion periplasmic adaptor subunit [Hyphomicrobiaceae bacterium]